MGGLLSYSGWPWTFNPPISASWTAGITDVHHYRRLTQVLFFFLKAIWADKIKHVFCTSILTFFLFFPLFNNTSSFKSHNNFPFTMSWSKQRDFISPTTVEKLLLKTRSPAKATALTFENHHCQIQISSVVLKLKCRCDYRYLLGKSLHLNQFTRL
jgi:hypothetical protein